MSVTILCKDLRLAPAERRRIQERVRLALSRFAPLVRGMSITVGDENGHRRGVDKSCRLVVRLHAGTVVVNERAEALMAAVSLAAERAARAVARLHHRVVDAHPTNTSRREDSWSLA
ncbi:MAG: HPF/RaiA family ribosome-associated protein [Planctomycetota bacterium]